MCPVAYVADPGILQRRQLAANLLAPVLAAAEEQILVQAVGNYRAGKLTGERAMGIMGELSSLRLLRLTTEADANRAAVGKPIEERYLDY